MLDPMCWIDKEEIQMKPSLLRNLVLTGALLSASACVSEITSYGYIPDPTLTSQLEKGKQNKEEVRRLLGTPSAIGTFEDNRWYYISKKVSTWAFMPPTTLEQKVLVVEFDPDSKIIAEIKKLEIKDAKDIALVERETPTSGKELTLIEQMIDNVGKFNPEAGSQTGF